MVEEKRTPYFCYLCEGTHSPLTEGSKCPTCGRIYCRESINVMRETGANRCPFCSQAEFSKFIPLFQQDKAENITFFERKPKITRDSTPVFEIDNNSRQNNSEEDNKYTKCMICWKPLTKGVVVLECPYCHQKGHRVHIRNWIAKKKYCPYCKEKISLGSFLSTTIDEEGHCSVCRMKISDQQSIIRCPNCNSPAHESHFKEWLRTRGNCPKCKVSLRKLPV